MTAIEIVDGDGASGDSSCTIPVPGLRHIEMELEAFVFHGWFRESEDRIEEAKFVFTVDRGGDEVI